MRTLARAVSIAAAELSVDSDPDKGNRPTDARSRIGNGRGRIYCLAR
jgi:hypothetical protein